MQRMELILTADDSIRLVGWRWLPDRRPPRASVLILHGMAEHIQRYEEFSAFLCDKGYAVYGFDLRGHGKTGDLSAASGILAPLDGWNRVLADIDLWVEKIRSEQPESPVVLFGHSMGSLVSKCYAARYGYKLRGMILSGPVSRPGLPGTIVSWITSISVMINGRIAPGKLVNQLIFRKYARSVKDRRTDYDWLSRDTQQVDVYLRDPHCGQVLSIGFYQDLFKGLRDAYKQTTYKNTPNNLPIYIFAGSRDPVGGLSRGVTALYKEYRKAGVGNITLKFYSGARHELLNETNRDEVYKDILAWLNGKFPLPPDANG